MIEIDNSTIAHDDISIAKTNKLQGISQLQIPIKTYPKPIGFINFTKRHLYCIICYRSVAQKQRRVKQITKKQTTPVLIPLFNTELIASFCWDPTIDTYLRFWNSSQACTVHIHCGDFGVRELFIKQEQTIIKRFFIINVTSVP